MSAHDEMERIKQGDPVALLHVIQWAAFDENLGPELVEGLDKLIGSDGHCPGEAQAAAGSVWACVKGYLESKREAA